MLDIIISIIISGITSGCFYYVLKERKTIILNFSKKYLTEEEKKNIHTLKRKCH